MTADEDMRKHSSQHCEANRTTHAASSSLPIQLSVRGWRGEAVPEEIRFEQEGGCQHVLRHDKSSVKSPDTAIENGRGY